jgi:hypothetical protein
MQWSRRTMTGVLLAGAWVAILVAGVPALLACYTAGGQSVGVTDMSSGSTGSCGEVLWVYVLLVAVGAPTVLWLDAPLRGAFGGRAR